MSDQNNLSVMGMIDSYASEQNVDANDIFKRPNTQQPVPENEPSITVEDAAISKNQTVPSEFHKKQKREWSPDASLTEGMPELQKKAAVYEKGEIHEEKHDPLKNIMDDVALKESRESMDDMSRKTANIEDAKARHGITKLQIPAGEIQTRFLIAASDPDYKVAQSKLDELLDEVERVYPQFILERTAEPSSNGDLNENIGKVDNVTPEQQSSVTGAPNNNKVVQMPERKEESSISEPLDEEKDVKVIIDKSALPTVSWSEEEVAKIKKSRSIELNIVEGSKIKFGEIEDVSENFVDRVLEQYQRKTNDIVAVLPASKYRATFTGLSYPEVLDLSTSQEMNTIDAELKKWSICFDHIKNPSIGAWEEYYLYTDPDTGKEIRVETSDGVSDGIDAHFVSKFEDFLRKTSFMDLDFMLWKILCATAKDKEIISIDCHAVNKVNGQDQQCGNTYDWIYSPSDLLDMTSINVAVLDEMKEAGEASTVEDIMRIYKSAPVNSMDTVELTTSGFVAVIGHVSAYEYLNDIYPIIKSLEEDNNDPTVVSRGMTYMTLSVVKAILIPNGRGGYKRIKGAKSIAKVVKQLDEFDWQTVMEISRMAMEPYQFKYSLKDIVCPKCKNRSTIRVEDMSRMLFIVARSLSSVQVTLKKA